MMEKEGLRLKEREIYLKCHSKSISCNLILGSRSGYVLNLSEIKTASKTDPLKSPTIYFEFEVQSKSQTGMYGVIFTTKANIVR